MQIPGAFPKDRSLALPLSSCSSDLAAAALPPGCTSSPPAGPAQSQALALPEILALIGHQLDRPSLARALRVSQLWHRSLIPVFWSALTIDVDRRRYTSSTSLDRWLDWLEPHAHYTRSLSLLLQRPRDQTTTTASTLNNGHDLAFDSHDHHDGSEDDQDDEPPLTPLQITARILSLRHATNIQAITLQTTLPLHSILLSAQRLPSLERLDIQTLGGAPPLLYLSDAFYAYPRLRHLRLAPLVPSFPLSNVTIPSRGRGSEILTTPSFHPQKLLRLQTLELHNVSWPAKDLLAFVACCPELRSLAISGRVNVAWDWTVATAEGLVLHCPKLERLHLHPRFATELAEPLIVRLLERLPVTQLVQLSIPNGPFGTALYELLMALPPQPPQETAVSSAPSARCRRRIECLTALNVSYTRKPGIFPRQLTQLLARASKLRHLEAVGVCLEPSLLDSSIVDHVSWRRSPPPPPPSWSSSSCSPLSLISAMSGASVPDSKYRYASWACKYLTTLKIGFTILGGDPSVARLIYQHLAQFEYLEHLCITPSYVPIRLQKQGGGGGKKSLAGAGEDQGVGLEALETLRRLRVFDSHGTKGDLSDPSVVRWMAKHWPKLTTLRVYLGGGGNEGYDDSGLVDEEQQEQHRLQVTRWFVEQGRCVQVLAA